MVLLYEVRGERREYDADENLRCFLLHWMKHGYRHLGPQRATLARMVRNARQIVGRAEAREFIARLKDAEVYPKRA